MKTRVEPQTILIVLLIFICKNIYSQTPTPESNPHRGLYVDNFFTINNSTQSYTASFSILGNSAREDSLLEFAMIHHITQLNLYDIRFIVGNSTLENSLCDFIHKAREHCIDQVGVVVEDPSLLNNFSFLMTPPYVFSSAQLNNPYFDNSLLFVQDTILPGDSLFEWAEVVKFLLNAGGLLCDGTPAFQVYNLEYEFWNPDYHGNPNPQTDYAVFLSRLSTLKNIQNIQNPNGLTEVYLNKMNQFSSPSVMAGQIEGSQSTPANADRILMTHYKSYMDSSTYDNQNKYFIYSDDPSLTATTSVTDRVDGFHNVLTRDHTDWHPLYSAESIYNSGDGNFTGNWLGRTSRFNIFSADMRYYDQWRNDNTTVLTNNSENNIQIGGTTWFSSYFLQKDLFNSLPYNKSVVPRPILFETNSPVCTSGGSGTVKFEYMGPLEPGINYIFRILDINCQDAIVQVSGTSNAYVPPSNINNSAHDRALSIIIADQTLPVGEYKAILTLNYSGSCSYSYEQPIIISSGQPKIVALSSTRFCDGGSVVLRGPATSNITWYKVGNPNPIANINTGEFSWPNSGHKWELTVRESGFYYACVGNCTTSSCQGKTNIIEVEVENNPPPVITTDCNTSGGSTPITLHAPSGQSWLWSNGSVADHIDVSYSHLRESYFVNVTQSNGCQRMAKVYIAQGMFNNAVLSPSITATPATINCPQEVVLQATFPASTCNQCGLGHYPNAAVAWSNGFSGTDIIHVNPTNSSTIYSAWLKDDHGCISKADYTINIANTASASNVTSIPNPCSSGNTINLSSSGGTAYLWSGPFSYTSSNQNPIITNSDYQRTGVYYVSVTNASCPGGLEAATSVNGIFNPPTAIITPSGATSFCNGNNVTLTANNSCGSYLWNSGESTQPITVSTSGNYFVTITDANGCIGTSTQISVIVSNPPTYSVQSTNITCNGANDGTISINVTTGVAPFSYSLTGNPPYTLFSGNTITINGLSPSTFQIIVIDNNGCESTISNITLSGPVALTCTANQVLPIPCWSSGSSQATAIVFGGNGGYTYSWLPSGGNSQTATNLSPGIYTVTCSDANGCGPVSATVTINEDPLCCGSPSSALTQNYFDTHTTLTGSWSLNSNITLSHDVTLDACTISVGAGYQIFTGDFTMTLKNGSVLESCNLMWKGILVSGEGVVNVLSDSYIKDAQYGIEARQGAMVVSDHGHFVNNYIGIYFNPIGSGGSINVTASLVNSFFDGSSLKAGYPSQMPSPLTHGCAGIYGEGITVLNIGAGGTQNNVFSNLNTGIYTDRTNTNVEKSQFIDILNYDSYFIPYLDAWGCGIYCHGNGTNLLNELGGNNPGNIDFQNCNVGIRTLSMEAFVIRNQVYNCDIGIEIKQSDNCKITVKENTLDCNLFGVELLFNDYAGIVNVSDNVISVGSRFIINGTSSPHAIGIDLAESRIKNYNRFIRNNEIDLFDYADQGISLNGANGYTIDHNYVYLNNINENIYGIGMAKSDNCTVACNSISGNSQSFTNTSQAAIWIQDCTSNTINCNGMTNTDIGLCFMGTCLGGSGNIVRSNDIGFHETGLLYKGLYTRVDHQDFRGNYWYLDTYSDFAARDENIAWAQFDKYIVDQNGPRFQNGQNHTNHPRPGEVDPSIFIQDGNTIDEQCGDKIHHGDCIYEPSGGGSETDRRIALNLEGSQQFDEETKWKAKESLYEKILNQPAYLDSDTVFVNFYQALSGTYLQRIAQINKEKEELYLSQQSLIQIIQSRSENIFLYSSAIKTIDSLLNKGLYSGSQKDSMWSTRSSILLNLQQLIMLNNASMSLLDSSVNSDIDFLSSENTLINSQNLIEDNEKVVNHAYFDLIIKKRTDLLGLYQSSLLNIASQCPLSGGPAVYTARSLVRLFVPTLRYNDELTCLQSGYSWRQGFDLHPVGISVSPNPTDTKLTVQYNIEDVSSLKLFDAVGVEVLSLEIDAQSDKIDIDVSNYPAGVYFCSVFKGGSQASDISEVIILH